MLSKNVNNKKCAPKRKKNQKDLKALFNTTSLHQFAKFNNFLWVF